MLLPCACVAALLLVALATGYVVGYRSVQRARSERVVYRYLSESQSKIVDDRPVLRVGDVCYERADVHFTTRRRRPEHNRHSMVPVAPLARMV